MLHLSCLDSDWYQFHRDNIHSIGLQECCFSRGESIVEIQYFRAADNNCPIGKDRLSVFASSIRQHEIKLKKGKPHKAMHPSWFIHTLKTGSDRSSQHDDFLPYCSRKGRRPGRRSVSVQDPLPSPAVSEQLVNGIDQSPLLRLRG